MLTGTSGFIAIYVLIVVPMFFVLWKNQGFSIHNLSSYFHAALISLPTCLVGIIAVLILKELLDFVLPNSITQPIASLAGFPAFGYLVGLHFYGGGIGSLFGGNNNGNDIHKRGAFVFDDKESKKIISENSRNAKKHLGRDAIYLAGVPIVPDDEVKHFKIIGVTGSGKSTAIRQLLDTGLSRGDRAVIADPDGGYLSKFYNQERGDIILNPFDRRSRKWNLYGEISTLFDIQQIAESLIPDTGSGQGDEFRAYARTFVASIIRKSWDSGKKDMEELWRLVAIASESELSTFLEGTPAKAYLASENARMFGSIRSVATTSLAALEYINFQNSRAFSVSDWIKNGSGVLFIPYQAGQIAAIRSLISCWVRLGIFQTMSQGEGDHRIWFIVDELDAIGKISGMKDALARIRKFGGRCVLGFQSISQVRAIYGDAEASTIVENCSNSLILRCSSSEKGGTSKFASDLIGQREIIRTQFSQSSKQNIAFDSDHSSSESYQHVTELAVLPSEIETLPDQSGYFKGAGDQAWLKIQFPYYEIESSSDSFQPS